MGLKSIFQEGMKERKRKRSLGKVSNEFKEKEKVHAVQLTVLGQKAWEAKADISAFADLQTTLGAAQNNLDDLRAQSEKLQAQKQENEATKKREDDRFAASQKEAAEKKRDVDRRLDEQKNAWQTLQKEVGQATSRLAAIAAERSKLEQQNRGRHPGRSGKKRSNRKTGRPGQEEDELKAAPKEKEEPGKTLPLQIAPCRRSRIRLHKQIESIRAEQKKTISEIGQKNFRPEQRPVQKQRENQGGRSKAEA